MLSFLSHDIKDRSNDLYGSLERVVNTTSSFRFCATQVQKYNSDKTLTNLAHRTSFIPKKMAETERTYGANAAVITLSHRKY